MEKKSQFGFSGRVEEAICDCHKGQFSLVVFLVHPVIGMKPVAVRYFTTGKEAEESCESFVREVAQQMISDMGIQDQIQENKAVFGEAALAENDRILSRFREENQGLN